jgi:cold shock protein
VADTGVVKFFDPERQYGFIVPDLGGSDLYAHVKCVEPGVTLEKGQRVKFITMHDAAKAKFWARAIRPI